MTFSLEIPREVVSEIRDRADIVEIISESVALKKTGNSFKGLCPFHQEKTPSFSVSPTKQLFYCFGCQLGGDVITFLERLTHQTYPEIIRDLADRYRIKIPEKPLSKDEKQKREEKKKNIQVMNLTQEFFAQNMNLKGKIAKNEALRRGYNENIIQKEGLGFSGEGWESLVNYLEGRKLSLSRAEKLGLIIPRKTGGYYSRFRNRLTFPIRNGFGELVGFGGRALDPSDKAKYLNTPESTLYKKSFSLYRIDQAKEAIRKKGYAVLTEGYFDALAFVASGFPNVVASCGTAFTLEQARILRRYTSKILTAFDGDLAGLKATVNAFSIMSELRMSHFVVPMQEKEDPDTLWQKKRAQGLSSRLQQAQSFLDFILEHLLLFAQKSLHHKTAAIRRIAHLIAKIPSPIEQELYQQKAAKVFGVSEKMVIEEGKKPKFTGPSTKKKLSGKETLLSPEGVVLGILMHRPDFISEIPPNFINHHFSDPMIKKLALELQKEFKKGNKIIGPEFLDQYPQIPSLTLRASEYIESETVDKVFKDCIQRLKSQRVSQDRRKLIEDLYQAEQNGDTIHAQEVLRKLQGNLEEQRENN